ncbi:MAG: cyclase family protein [Clostridia bacterium]|nr:cyclase family protein [Clostridia bacterium]
MKLIDITRELMKSPVYPGDPAPQVQALSRVSMGDPCNTGAVSMCLHNGTHMDAPRHFFNEGEAIDRVSLDSCIGECVVLECNGLLLGDRAEELLPYLKKRVLFKGDVQLTPSAAFVLSDAGVLLLGVEQPSVAPPEYTAEVHRQLLQSGMVLLENLDLSEATVGETYLLMAAPVKIAGADGAPVRAVLAESDRIDWDGRIWR